MSRSPERSKLLIFTLGLVGWLACAFAWAAVLSFDSADPPAFSAWSPSAPGIHNWCGPIGSQLAFVTQKYLGVGVYPLLVLLTLAVWAISRHGRIGDAWLRSIGLMLIIAAYSTAATLALPQSDKYLMWGPGGVLGVATSHALVANLGMLGTWIVLAAAMIVGVVVSADEVVVRTGKSLHWAGKNSAPALAKSASAVANAGAAVANAGASVASGVASLSGKLTPASKPPRRVEAADPNAERDAEDEAEMPRPSPRQLTLAPEQSEDNDAEDLADETLPAVEPRAATPPAEKRGPVITEIGADRPAQKPSRASSDPPPSEDYVLPSLALLDDPVAMDKQAIERACREKALILEQTMQEFRIDVQVVAVETGPVITVFELKLSPGIKVSQIASLSNDMARALKAPSVRVNAPLPGKDTIGIEVPNIDKERVRLKEILGAVGRSPDGSAIPLYLGKDSAGQALVTDLTRMPHLLVAGTTGSGKSVCISSIVMSILMTRTPNEVNLILVDPKVVELAMFKDIPHLMCPIVTEMSKAEGILDWAATKMDERYALLAEAGVKDIRSYNRLGNAGLKERLNATDEEMEKVPVHLPYIIIVIDELADLMMMSAKEVEFYLCRIAQKSRAVGIHLIVSTQRPQANVVTGLIKSNLPCRIAFRVSSRLDSRIVLDQNGGEVLMGQGDMLFLPPGSSKLLRCQGTFISDEELRRIVQHCKVQRPQQFNTELVKMPGSGGDADAERDELFDQAVDIILETGRGSVSLLQRRLTVGYGRASRLVDQMYQAGIVGEYKGSQAREVIVSKEDWEAMKSMRDREEADESAEAEQ